MKYAYLIALAVAAMAATAQAQTKIYRCGNTYTNSETEARAKGCKPLDGGNITVVEGTKVNGVSTAKVAPDTTRYSYRYGPLVAAPGQNLILVGPVTIERPPGAGLRQVKS